MCSQLSAFPARSQEPLATVQIQSEAGMHSIPAGLHDCIVPSFDNE